MSIETYQGNGGGNGSLTHYQNHQPELAPKRTLTRLIEWAQAADAAHRVAQNLVQTSFVPVQFRDKPHEATAAILAGDEIGLSPMASLNAFSIIQGAAAPKAMTMRAVVQSHGHEVWQAESTDTRAIFKGRRRGSEEVHESEWTIERAHKLGLVNRNPEWKKQPKAMLIARATSEVCRLTAADAILGIPYSAEELADGVRPGEDQAPPQEQVAAPQETTKRTARRRTQPASPAPKRQDAPQEAAQEPTGPPLPGEDGYDDAPATDQPEMATKPQLTRLATVFTNGGVNDRTTRLQVCCLIVGREITSSTELTKAEAHSLIDQLEKLPTDDVTLAEVIAEMIGDEDEAPAGGEQE